jgi:hypothetical protein
MKQDIIKARLSKYYSPERDTILLEIIEGNPYGPEGGSCIEITPEDMEAVTERPDFSPEGSQWKKYLDKWYIAGLITAEERDTGKTKTEGL